MSNLTAEQVQDYLERTDQTERLCLLHGNSSVPGVAQRIINILLLKQGITPSKIIKEYVDIAEGRTLKRVMNGSGEILTQVDDPKVRLDALSKLLDLTGIKDTVNQTRENDNSIDLQFEDLIMQEQVKLENK